MALRLSIKNTIKQICKQDVEFHNGLNLICGVNGAGKTNLLDFISNNHSDIALSPLYKNEQISYINIQHVSMIVTNQSNQYNNQSLLTVHYQLENISQHLANFKTFCENITLSGEPELLIDNFEKTLNDQDYTTSIICIDYLRYLCQHSHNILDINLINKRDLFNEYSHSGRLHKLIESPISNLFAEKCLAYQNYSAFMARKEMEIAINEGRAFNFSFVNDELEKTYGKLTAPYEELNKLFEIYGFNNRLIHPDISQNYSLVFSNKSNTAKIPFNELSTGEKIIVLIMTFIDFSKNKTKLLLIDELDAYLNPKMSQMLISIIRDFVVEKLGIDVLMTTHNPITVNCMLEDKDSIFWVEDGKISESKKFNVLQLLTPGMFTFSNNSLETIFNLEEKKCLIFTEGYTDIIHLESAISILKPELLNRIKFVDLGKGSSNAETVKLIIEKLSLIQNISLPKVIGILDRDHEGDTQYEKLKSKLNFFESENKLYIKKDNFFVILLSSDTKNKFKDNYNPVELLYSEDFLNTLNILTVINQNQEKEKIKQRYIKGGEVYLKSIDSTQPFDVYLIDDNKKKYFAKYIESNIKTWDKKTFDGFKILIQTIDEILIT